MHSNLQDVWGGAHRIAMLRKGGIWCGGMYVRISLKRRVVSFAVREIN